MGSSTFANVETQCNRVPFHAIGQIIEIFRKKVGPARDNQPFALAILFPVERANSFPKLASSGAP
jgi:hypothetical protein